MKRRNKKTLFFVILCLVILIVTERSAIYCKTIKLEKKSAEWFAVMNIVETLRRQMSCCISKNDYLEGRIPTPWRISKLDLKIRLQWMGGDLIETKPFLKIKYRHKLYRVELRWIAKDVKITEDESNITIDFSPVIGIGTNPQYGLFPLTVYDEKNVTWKCYLFDIDNPCQVVVDPFSHHTFEEDQQRLKNYDLWKYYKEEIQTDSQ